MADAKRDGNRVPTLIGVSSVDSVTPTLAAVNPVNGRLLVDLGSSGTVTNVASADGSITVTNPTTTVDLAVVKAPKWSTARNLAGNSVDGSANVAFANKFIVQGTTDAGLSAAQFLGALGTGIVKNTTTTGVLSIAVAGDFPTLNQNTTGTAAGLTTGRTIAITGDLAYTSPSFDGTGNVTAAGTLATVNTNTGSWGSATQVGTFTVNGKGLITAAGNTTVTPAVGSITGLGTGVATFLATPSSANLAAALTDETGSGAAVFGTTPTIATPVINGLPTGTGVAAGATVSTLAARDASGNLTAVNHIEGFTTVTTAAGTTTLTVTSNYTQVFTGSSTQIVLLPTTSIVAGQQYFIVNQSTGAVTVQSSGANTIVILAASTSAIFTAVVATPTTAANWDFQYASVKAASGKSGTFSNTITLAGTDATTMTFPSTSATVAGLGTTQTFTGQDKFNNFIDVNNAVTVASNAGTVPVTFRLNTFTNSSAATMAITMATASAVDGQMTIVRIYDFSAVAQTIGWTNTENSTVTAPLTSNGSTTLPLTVGFMYNSQTSKWRCIASA